MAKGRSGIGKHPMPPKNESQDSPADEIKHVRPYSHRTRANPKDVSGDA